jgi:methylated-DNA-[protein]-cysteine S-methyltransferase
MRHAYLDTPIGQLLAVADDAGLRQLSFENESAPEGMHDPEAFENLAAELAEYFAGRLRAFTIPLAPRGTPFQQSVWQALQAIPYGSSISYAQLAVQLKMPNGARAVGNANACNPIPILIPCHRVIGGNGQLTGYRGGIPIKRTLLDLEQGLVPAA